MLYLGIGNAGSQILNHFRRQVLTELKLEMPEARMALGDADINNSVIHRARRENLFDSPPPIGMRVLPLDQFWSGGCGVYHIIGELLAEEAHRRNQITGVLNSWVPQACRNGINVFISAGGGTGGGAGIRIAQILNERWNNPPTRIFAAVPELDHFAQASGTLPEERLNITGHDSFQCASAGRLLAKFLASPGKLDLFLISNGYLAAPPPNLGFTKAVERIDQFITRLVLLLDDTYRAGNQGGHLVTAGIGRGNWVAPGAPHVADAVRLGQRLAKSALEPLDLNQAEPTGLSALPVDLDQYRTDLAQALASNGQKPDAVQLSKLRSINALRQTLQVDAWLYHSQTATAHEKADPGQVRSAVEATLASVFYNVPINVRLVQTSKPNLMPPDTDFCLLVLLISPLVEEVYRLMAYYVQSTFEWQGGKIDDIANLIDEILTGTIPLDDLREQLGKAGAKIRLGNDGRETYTPHFWGNFDHLKGKVLQSLRRSETDIQNRLLSIDDVFSAFGYLREQLWRPR